MMNDKRWVIIEVSTAFMLKAMAFPDGAEVVACNGENAPLGTIKLVIASDDLPAVGEGQPIPVATPVFTELTDAPPRRFYDFEWGLQEESIDD